VLEEQQDYQRAAGAYLVWPLALAALVQESPEASRWARIHTRQALVFGVLATLGYLVLMALPLVVVIVDAGISTGLTVTLYTVGLALDAIAFVLFAVRAFSYAARAGRGELFAIPLVAPIADRLFTIRR
jgi:uncharacterized membrane protein